MILLLSNWIWISFFAQAPVAEEVPDKSFHPFYVSFTEVNHNAVENSLEISCKFFADDFEQTLETAYKAKLDIAIAKDKPLFDRFIADYVSKHLSISADGKPGALQYVGYEKEAESVYCYFEITGVKTARRIDFTNNLLYDFSKEQMNIMHATVASKRKSGKLNYPEEKIFFQY